MSIATDFQGRPVTMRSYRAQPGIDRHLGKWVVIESERTLSQEGDAAVTVFTVHSVHDSEAEAHDAAKLARQ